MKGHGGRWCGRCAVVSTLRSCCLHGLAMALNIRNPEASRLAAEVAALAGESKTVAVIQASEKGGMSSGVAIALIVGLYRTLIESIADGVAAGLRLIRGDVAGAKDLLSHIRWRVLIPVLAGMAVALVAGAALLEPLIEDYPVQSRALFFGLVAMGLVVPIRMTGRWRRVDVVVVVVAAAAAAVLVGLPPGTVADPGPLQIFGAAAVAVCALVLPGVPLDPDISRTWLTLACAGAAVVGHCYPVWDGLDGGKGVDRCHIDERARREQQGDGGDRTHGVA